MIFDMPGSLDDCIWYLFNERIFEIGFFYFSLLNKLKPGFQSVLCSKRKYCMLKKINLFVFISFYLVAGVNHFVHPVNYLAIIPPYLPFKEGINYLSGALEIVCAILMAIPSLRLLGSWCIIALLVALIPAHIYLIQVNGCPSSSFCFPPWIAWVRLIPFQFILMWWAYKTGKSWH